MAGGPSQDHPLLVLWTDNGLIQGVIVLNQISCRQLFCAIASYNVVFCMHGSISL